uniref:7TM_GPCR_Srx domain-containing protein n=1 Tax=Heterorhabditis bacteriophora TaxID=37862 RepID=A0A1I7WSL2_HETBA
MTGIYQETAEFAENLAIVIWIFNTMLTLLLFSIPAFIIHEEGDKLLGASFKMYHETLCEERDLLVLSQMNFLAFQMHSTKLTLTAGHYFYMNRKILLSLFSAIFTYFLILVQFDTSGAKYHHNATDHLSISS